MPKPTSSRPISAPPCDPRLPAAALKFRRQNAPPLTNAKFLRCINVTVWLYQDKAGRTDVQVNPNTPIKELIQKFGPAETPDAEVGFHSEMHAGEWFRVRPHLKVLQIFSERIPCAYMCGPFLRTYYRDVPWYYYYDERSWRDANGKVEKKAEHILKMAYEL